MSTTEARERLAQLQTEYHLALNEYTTQRYARKIQPHVSAYEMPIAVCTEDHFRYLKNKLNIARNRLINQRAAMGLEYIGI